MKELRLGKKVNQLAHFFPKAKAIPGTVNSPLKTGRKLKVHKTFRRCPGRLLNVLCTFSLRSVPRGSVENI